MANPGFGAILLKVWVELTGEQSTALGSSQIVDISEAISNLKYSRDVEKENNVRFTVEQRWIEPLRSSFMRKGQTIMFQYGYLGGKKSKVHKARITQITRRYATKQTLIIAGRDLGTIMKKTSSNKVWSGKTTYQIAQEVAERYGLEFQGIPTTKVWDSYPQAQKDDYSFLQELVAQDEDGNLLLYIDDGVMYLKRRATDTPSFLTFEYGKGDKIIGFDVREVESMKTTGAASSTTIAGFDPDKKEPVVSKADNNNEGANVALGQIKNVFSADGEFKEERGTEGFFDSVVSTGETIVSSLSNPNDVQDKARAIKKQWTFTQKEGILKIWGEPTVDINQVVTMSGVDKEDEGNYLIKQIDDDVTSTTYTTMLQMLKNASRKPSTTSPNEVAETDAVQVNESVGALESQQTKLLVRFDADGNRLPDKLTQYKAPS